MDYSFNGEVAALYGVDEAVFIHNIYWWIRKNEANGRHYYDGKNWTYNSMEAFTKLFPFWTKRQVERIVRKLKDAGAIYVGNYNASAMDRTQWYALDNTVTCIYANGDTQTREPLRANTQTRTPIPDSKPDSKPDINNTPLPPRGKPPKKSACEKAHSDCLQALASAALPTDHKAKLAEWLQHKRERKDSYTATGFAKLIAEYQNNIQQFGQDAVFRVIDQSMAAGYAGIVWDRLKGGRTERDTAKPIHSSYDIDEIERALQNGTPRL